MLKGKTIVLGVTGCIAAYKAPDIARRFIKLGAKVVPMMTDAACQFITPLTMESVTSKKAISSLFDLRNENRFGHLALAREADLVLIAPCTANTVAKIANGVADNAITTLVLSTRAPIVLALAMNEKMYVNKQIQSNINKLCKKGVCIIEPEEGSLACGEEGKGRLAKIQKIIDETLEVMNKSYELLGKKILVTAGGTRENIDPVRFIGNRASGKMGYRCAAEFRLRGAEVRLIGANSNLEPPAGVEVLAVETANQMREQVLKNYQWSDAIVMTAAVGDWRPETCSNNKIKEKNVTLKLVENPDILAELGKKKDRKILVGFVAETKNLIANAKKKLEAKNLDFILVNDVSKKKTGMGKDYCDYTYISADKTKKLGLLRKEKAAIFLADELKTLLDRITKGK